VQVYCCALEFVLIYPRTVAAKRLFIVSCWTDCSRALSSINCPATLS